jgi:hypothetical protein
MPIDGRATVTDISDVVRPDAIPAMYEHAAAVYAAMREVAVQDETTGQVVYEGHLTALFRKLHLSVPYYTHIKNRLVNMGCIEQLRRGGGTAQSRWILWKVPTLEEYKQAVAGKPRTRGDWYLGVEQRQRDMMRLIKSQDEQIVALWNVIGRLQAEMERRNA